MKLQNQKELPQPAPPKLPIPNRFFYDVDEHTKYGEFAWNPIEGRYIITVDF